MTLKMNINDKHSWNINKVIIILYGPNKNIPTLQIIENLDISHQEILKMNILFI